MKKLVSRNPADNYKRLGSVNVSSKQEIKEKVILANKAKTSWKELGLKKRISLLKPLKSEFIKKRKQIINLITDEMGKTLKQSTNEFDSAIGSFDWFTNDAIQYIKDENIKNKSIIMHEPYGVAAVITPWNYPFDMFLWGVIPNLIAGNTVVFKHSEQCPLIGKLLEKIMNKINLPKGVFSEIYGDGKQGSFLVDQKVDLIWFTGSSKVGKRLYETAGKKFIPCLMELGGSNPGIVFADANIDNTIGRIYTKRYANCGQVCNALKRLIVHESIFDEVVEKLKNKVETTIIGQPKDKNTSLSSLVSKKQLKFLKLQVQDAIKKGAKVITGGKKPRKLKGAYYLPTLLTNITTDMKVWRQEVFGPVLAIVPFKTEEQAIKLANDTRYGLGAYIFTSNEKKALRVASKIDAGIIRANKAQMDITLPFGGYKDSGKGRELGKYTFESITQVKVVTL